jgi:iron(II)-dependent oxidoreductase
MYKHSWHGIFLALAVFLGAAAALAQPSPSKTRNATEMTLIPGGPFMMGSSKEDIDWIIKNFYSESREWYEDETPAQAAFVKDFYLDNREVTISQYWDFLEEDKRPAPKLFGDIRFNSPNQPAVGVTWQDASDYCRWAGKRLPSEAEWEKAARGKDARKYPWGNDPTEAKANTRGFSDQYKYTAPVGSFPDGKSPYGILDMSGNVWEWTQDWYLPYPGNEIANENYGENFKVIRGGSWYSNLDLARAATRGKALPEAGFNYLGFRCARDAAEKTDFRKGD